MTEQTASEIAQGLGKVARSIGKLTQEVKILRECIVAGNNRLDGRPVYDVRALDDTTFLHLCPYCGEEISEGETKCHKCGGAIIWRSKE